MCTLSRPGQARGQATELGDGVHFPKIITVTLLPHACPDTLTLYTLFERWGKPPIFLNQQVCNFEGSNISVCVHAHTCTFDTTDCTQDLGYASQMSTIDLHIQFCMQFLSLGHK